MPQMSIFKAVANNVRLDKDNHRIEPEQFFKIENVFEEELKTYPDEIKKNYEYNEETRTYTLNNDVWAKGWRQHGPYYYDPTHPKYIQYTIGGSSVGALIQGNLKDILMELYGDTTLTAFHCRAELYCEKKGITFDLVDEDNSEVFHMGHVEEPTIRAEFPRLFEKEYPGLSCRIINDTHMYHSKEHPYMLCNLDGLVEIDGVMGVFEAKTIRYSSKNYDLWKKGIVPIDYFIQCHYYMSCMNLPFAIICVKFGMDDYAFFLIMRDFSVEEAMLTACEEFVNCLINDTPPSEEDENIELINRLWRKRMGTYAGEKAVVHLADSKKTAVEKLNALNIEIEQLNERIDELESKKKEILVKEIFPEFGNATYGIVQLDDEHIAKIKLKNSASFKLQVDGDALKNDHPDIYESYQKTKTSLDTTRLKKEHREIYDAYAHPNNVLTDAKANYCEITIEDKKF